MIFINNKRMIHDLTYKVYSEVANKTNIGFSLKLIESSEIKVTDYIYIKIKEEIKKIEIHKRLMYWRELVIYEL